MSYPEGLELHRDVITPEEEQTLLAAVAAAPWNCALKRRTQHYGYEYNYASPVLTPAEPIPGWLTPLRARLEQLIGVAGAAAGAAAPPPYFDQVIVNEYLPGQGITPHTDHLGLFGPVVVSVSLGWEVPMEFSKDALFVSVPLPRRSAVVLRGAARTHWRHAIAARKTDGPGRPRCTRVSLTFRRSRHA